MSAHEPTVTVHDWSTGRVAIDRVSKDTAISNGQGVITACQIHVAPLSVLTPFGVSNKSFSIMLAYQDVARPTRRLNAGSED